MRPADTPGHDGTDVKEQFSPEELRRYARHFVLPEFGPEAQVKCKRASVLVVGAGGLGSPVLMYLAAAGVGTIGIADPDVVDESNLQRQVIHGSDRVGEQKSESARRTVASINPHVRTILHTVAITSANALSVIADYDVVVDGTDNFPTRYLLNDACVLLRKPLIYGSIFRFEGQVAVFDATRGPCYRCLYPEPPPADMVPGCAEAGVLGVLPGIVGTLQATEVLKCITGIGEPLVGRLLLCDALRMSMDVMTIGKDRECPVCGDRPTIDHLIDYEAFCNPTRQEEETMIQEITVGELKKRTDKKDSFVLLDVRQEEEHEFVNIGGKVVPLHELAERIGELDPGAETIVYCRSGSRSATAVRFLQGAGFSDVKNLKGGILAWAREIDPGLPRY